jgi:DNA-binding LacI/PurR family transcriptional regulator
MTILPASDSTGVVSEKIETPTAIRRRTSPGARTVGLADVARAAGVSTASASRAMTRPELVSEALRARVQGAASRLGYVANAAARSLSTQRSGLVGVVLGDASDPVAVGMLAGAERSLARGAVGVLLRVANDEASAASCAKSLEARGVEGLLWIGGEAPNAAAWHPGRDIPCASCGLDNAAATGNGRGRDLAYAYLRQLGHRDIGAIGLRREGSLAASAPPTAEVGIESCHDVDAVRAGVRELVQRRVTAIVAGSELIAAAVLNECRGMGMAVPGEMSVIALGDTALSRCSDPPLTAVRIPAHAEGYAAAEWLVAAMAGRDASRPEVPWKLVIRASTGAPGR